MTVNDQLGQEDVKKHLQSILPLTLGTITMDRSGWESLIVQVVINFICRMFAIDKDYGTDWVEGSHKIADTVTFPVT